MRVATGLFLFAAVASDLGAQIRPPAARVAIRGDTAGAPTGCPAAAIKAVQGWFQAIAIGDTVLAKASVSPTQGPFSVIPFATTEHLWRGDSSSDLLDYVRRRSHAHETLTLHTMIFSGWLPLDVSCRSCERQILGFLPRYQRSANDLPPGRHEGTGKGGYNCEHGLMFLNLAPCINRGRDQCPEMISFPAPQN